MTRTPEPEEVFDGHAHALGDGNPDSLIRVQAFGFAVQHNR
jgi:hypothetical protein